ncbi:hypothetical protein RvY_09074 [Ramazzottius varieornatus]|uniref:Uncharacterized protein n=1 Tax=Ramazzottius varieornatus TaxID=947166 RepID=A0A1D1VAK1_RAMVA|nr:hypothetical protein RvY_09074 [Ramazzottius varieornatus]
MRNAEAQEETKTSPGGITSGSATSYCTGTTVVSNRMREMWFSSNIRDVSQLVINRGPFSISCVRVVVSTQGFLRSTVVTTGRQRKSEMKWSLCFFSNPQISGAVVWTYCGTTSRY